LHEDEVIAKDVTEDVREDITTGPIIVDVRTKEEFDYGAYPNAVNIPLDELGNRMSELGEKDRKITLYCASGARSAYALRFLKSNGYSNSENGGGLARMMAGYNKS
jgi:rhodanese-related sulfurtransferase